MAFIKLFYKRDFQVQSVENGIWMLMSLSWIVPIVSYFIPFNIIPIDKSRLYEIMRNNVVFCIRISHGIIKFS